MKRRLALVVLAAIGCSSKTSGGFSQEQANPCATKNATYEETIVEQAGGTCGPVPTQIVNIGSDGTIDLPTAITCQSLTGDGCTTRGSDCTFTSQGIDFTETFESTFSSDGSTMTGLVTLIGSETGQTCSSTYNVTATRQ